MDEDLSWDDARAFCHDRFFDLASAHNDLQKVSLAALCAASARGGGCKVWCGRVVVSEIVTPNMSVNRV